MESEIDSWKTNVYYKNDRIKEHNENDWVISKA